MKLRRLPDTELEVLKALWAAGGETPRAQLEDALAPRGWASNTVNTYLARLTQKGFVSCRRLGKSNYYTPLVTREEYQSFEGKAVLDQLFGSSLKGFVASLTGDGQVEAEELDELQSYLDDLRREDKP